jgi:hypothetical protein
MIIPRYLAGSALLIAWALLLGARCIAATIYATAPGGSYEMGLVHIGWILPAGAWLSLGFGLFLLLGKPRTAPSTAPSASCDKPAEPTSSGPRHAPVAG